MDEVNQLEGFPAALTLSAPDWPPQTAKLHPGDLTHFLTQGFGLGPPPVILPYGAPDGAFYGFDQRSGHPFLNAPTTEPSGGTLYFDDRVDESDFKAALSLMGVTSLDTYIAYAATAQNPVEERYLDQLRFVSFTAMSAVFQVSGIDPPATQSLPLVDAFVAFVATQKAKWNDSYTFSGKLRGTAGGDGDWAKESLAFGFHVENSYWGVYRMWSRPWLVTK